MRALKQSDTRTKKADVSGMTKDQMIETMEKMNKGRKDNLESRRSALNTLMGAIPVGGKIFAIVPLDELHIDESYQRSLQNHVKIIARDWNPTKCDPLKINFREDGFFYVWDGFHRKTAAELRGIKKPDPYDIFKANVCAGEEIDTAIKDMCDKYDLLVNRNNKRAGNLSCLTLAREIFKRGDDDREYFEWVLELLHSAKWNEFPQSHCHRVVNSLYEIRKGSGEENVFVQRRLKKYLENTNPDDLLINATIKYHQFKDESKKLKLFLLDIVNGDGDLIVGVIGKQDRYIA